MCQCGGDCWHSQPRLYAAEVQQFLYVLEIEGIIDKKRLAEQSSTTLLVLSSVDIESNEHSTAQLDFNMQPAIRMFHILPTFSAMCISGMVGVMLGTHHFCKTWIAMDIQRHLNVM